MDSTGFLLAIEKSFGAFIQSGTSRSTAKLVPLHGAIAEDMHERLGEGYSIQSQGYAQGREGTIEGRYMPKKVDITILRKGKPVCGIAVKFVMQNYSQNSNNYFENMLGETANIRAAKCPYFQLLVIPDKMPYYDKRGYIKHWETVSQHNLGKYFQLDSDNPEVYFHSPNKTLIYVIHLPEIGPVPTKDAYRQEYAEFLATHQSGYLTTAQIAEFGRSVIINDYATFADKIYHTILAL